MTGSPLVDFAAVMRRLRAECPWKAEQTHRSLARYLLEETHETLEAIEDGDATGDWTHLREELGDLLLQVYFHGVIAEESGAFTLDQVAEDVIAKMHRRNPHVFGDDATGSGTAGLSAAEVDAEWQRRKAAEKSERTGPTDGLPPGLPALLLAEKVLGRLGPDAPVPTGDGLGEQLLALVARARSEGLDAEQELRETVRRLARRA